MVLEVKEMSAQRENIGQDEAVMQYRELVRGLLHDLRGPIRRAAAAGQMIDANEDLPAAIREPAKHLVSGLIALEPLFRNAGIYADALEPVAQETCSLSAAMERVVYQTRPGSSELGLEISWKPDADLAVVGRERDVVEIFRQLIDNSLKFGATQIWIEAGNKTLYRDNGPGIGPADWERVFQPFQRLHGQDIPGHGLGLAICRQLAHRMGASIDLTEGQPETPGFQAVLSLQLPAQ